MKAFEIFPWQNPFLPALKDFVDAQGNPGSAVIIIPNNRPKRYFLDLYKKSGKAALVPKMLTFEEAAALWRAQSAYKPQKMATMLDQAALLYQAVQQVKGDQGVLEKCLAQMDLERFLPWGLRLAQILEETFKQGVEISEFPVSSDEAGEFPAALLSSLGTIRQNWQKLLENNQLTTPGLDLWEAGKNADQIPALIDPGNGRSVFIAGFYTLDGVQNKLLKKLWDNGAVVCLHTDQAIAAGAPPHWTASEHARWIKDWKAQTHLHNQAPDHKPQISFFSGYDTHTQLKELNKDLKTVNTQNSAIVLTHPDLLLPTLHHLPDKNINISMGYPLERSSFHTLMETLFNLQFNKNPNGEVYHRDLLELINNPYLKLLTLTDGDGQTHNLRKIFNQLVVKIGAGKQYIDYNQFFDEAALTATEQEKILLLAIRQTMLDSFKAKMTPADLGSIIENIHALFVKWGEDFWKHYHLEAETLQRLLQNIVPVLTTGLLVNSEFDIRQLHDTFNDLISQERVAFEADPIVGSQILGMFETRLLQFDNLFILDATEDFLPGPSQQNPVLPDSLRFFLRLPDSHQRDKIAAYNLARLCNCAKEVKFLWQEGIFRSGLFDGKKSRSRFIEELIWKEEQDNKKIFKPGDRRLPVAMANVTLKPALPGEIAHTPVIDQAISKFLSHPISPTSLDKYLNCPFQFIMRHILRIAPPDTVTEGEDALSIGTFVHKVLEMLYTPYKGKTVKNGDITPQKVDEVFDKVLKSFEVDKIPFTDLLPADSLLWLKAIGPQKIKKFIQAQPDTTYIQDLEKRYDAKVDILGEELNFTGKMDRIDIRDKKIHILDYKTGNLNLIKEDFWGKTDLFNQIKEALQSEEAFKENATAIFNELRENIPSIQLLLYVLLSQETGLGEIGNASLVDLKESGKEKQLFAVSPDKMDEAIENCELILGFLLKHLKNSPVYPACENDKCGYCEYAALCKN